MHGERHFWPSSTVGLIREKRDIKKSYDGNFWALLCFFCIRIPRLCEKIGFDIPSENLQAPLLMGYMQNMTPVSKNSRHSYMPAVASLLEELDENEIRWHPYNINMLNTPMLDQLPYVTRIGPLFCLNHVGYHQPVRFRKQFQTLAFCADTHISSEKIPKLKHKVNSGSENQDFETIYKKECELWNKAETAESYIRRLLKLPDPSSSHAAIDSPEDNNTEDDGDGDGDAANDGGGDAANDEDDNMESDDNGVFDFDDGYFSGDAPCLEGQSTRSPMLSVIPVGPCLEGGQFTRSPMLSAIPVQKKKKRKDPCLEEGQSASDLPVKRGVKILKGLNIKIQGSRVVRTPRSRYSPSGKKKPA